MVDTWSALPLVKKRYKIYFQQIVELLNLQQIQNTVFGMTVGKYCVYGIFHRKCLSDLNMTP